MVEEYNNITIYGIKYYKGKYSPKRKNQKSDERLVRLGELEKSLKVTAKKLDSLSFSLKKFNKKLSRRHISTVYFKI